MREAPDALQALTEAIGTALRADAAVVRALEEDGGALVARTVWAGSQALSAELIGSSRPSGEEEGRDATVLRLPIRRGEELVGELELLRRAEPFGDADESLARSAAAQAGLVLAATVDGRDGANGRRDRELQLAGDALAAGGDATQLAYLAAQATGAEAAVLWRTTVEGSLELAAEVFVDQIRIPELEREAQTTLFDRDPVSVTGSVASVRLGEPSLGVLQLVYEEGAAPQEGTRALLASFGVRAAQALRSSETLEETEAELERTRALVEVIGQAIAQLSLSHTLETAVDRIAALLDVERVAVYLRESGKLNPVSGRGLVGPHARVAERLLVLALGPLRGRQALILGPEDARTMLAGVRGEMTESGIEAALAVPLLAQNAVIGLLAVYPSAERTFDQNEIALITALAAQLAVAVENARLHEETKRLAAEREEALRSEQQKARQLRAQYEISHSFTHSLSLEATLAAVTRAVVDVLEIDAAVMRLPDGRGDALEARSVHVANPNLAALETILARDQPLAHSLWRSGEPVLLDRKAATELPGHDLLVPFLERGASAVVVPVATSGETLATLTLVSLDPERPLRGEVVESARAIAGQAALAIDNARLYHQQKSFADAMQRSLLPRTVPELEGLDVGAVYESSARVDVGGDVFDFLALPDGRLAVVLGDVTGHGIEAAADMAMAKFVFRSLTREHPEPGDFLAAANEVVTSEIGFGKFITLASVLVDAAGGEIVWASAGHPPGRLVGPDGVVGELPSRGLALGIDAGQTYDEERVSFEPGAVLVLYTDGLIERRRGQEQYGTERLDEALSRAHSLPAQRLAQSVLADCRAFGSGELADDCAIVVIKRTTP